MNKLMLFSALLLLQGCASVKTGNQKFLDINSHPEGAEVWINDQYVCDTPCQHDVTGARNEIFRLSIRKEGYRPYHRELEPKTNKEVEADLIMCLIPPVGLTMLGVDYYTGSMWDYETVNAVLYKDILKNSPALPDVVKPLSMTAKEYIVTNFGRLKEEAFASSGARERIRTLSSLTSVNMERLAGMISEAQNAQELIGFLQNDASSEN